jgi:hypothetical protein
MKAMILGVLVLSLTLLGCMSETDVGQIEDEVQVQETPGAGQSCHVDATGVFNGTMTQNGSCCGSATGDDGELHYTCSSCDYYKCNPGPDLAKSTGPHIPPTPRG